VLKGHWDVAKVAYSLTTQICELVSRLITELDDESFGLIQLRNDLIHRRIPEEVRRDIIRFALKTGEHIADIFLCEGSSDPLKLIQSLKIKVREESQGYRFGSVYFFSEYVGRPPTIVIYSRSMEELATIIDEHGLSTLLGIRDPTPVFLAHEMFHHLEKTKIGDVGGIFRVRTFRLGSLKITSGIHTLSDVAAYHFAKKLLILHFPPALLPYLILMKHEGKEITEEILAWINEQK